MKKVRSRTKNNIPITFEAIYMNEKINAYFVAVSFHVCGYNRLLLFKDVDKTFGEPIAFIGCKAPFKVKKNEIVIQQADICDSLFLDICRHYGLVSFVRSVGNDFEIYKINRSEIKTYIYYTMRNKEFYDDIQKYLISSSIKEIVKE